MAMSNEDLLKELSAKPIMEVVELVKMLEEEWGVSAAAPVAVAAGPAAGGDAGEAAAEKDEFDVVPRPASATTRLPSSRPFARSPALASRKPRTHVEGAPSTRQGSVAKDEAEELKKTARRSRRNGRTQVVDLILLAFATGPNGPQPRILQPPKGAWLLVRFCTGVLRG